MNFDPIHYNLLLQDAVYAMAVGFITGFFYHLMSVFLYRGKVRIFIRDFISCIVFAVLLFSYCVSFANYPVLRWFHVIPAAAGRVLFSPCFDIALRTVLQLAAASAGYFFENTKKKTKKHIRENIRKIAEKRQKFPQKNPEELLKQDDILLYN